MTAAYRPRPADLASLGDVIGCVTAAETDLADPAYLAVCTGVGEVIAVSRNCPGDGPDSRACGGHPICRPCHALGVERGLILEGAHHG